MYRIVKRRDGTTVRIPVGEDGYVPFDAYVERNDKRSRRARTMDSKRVSRRLLNPLMTPEDAADWWVYPERSDIEGVDAPARKREVIPPKKRDPKEFFGENRRRSSVANLPWLSDPQAAQTRAREMGVSEDMIRAYQQAAWDDLDVQLGVPRHTEMFDSNSKRPRNRRRK